MYIRKNRKLKPSKFELKWGKDVHWFAHTEGVSPAAIQMRVMNNGSPWLRKAEPSDCEKDHRKTVAELAEELNIHPQTVLGRLVAHGDPYNNKTGAVGWSRGQNLCGTDWHKTTQWGKMKPWMMAECPLYDNWKTGNLTWQQVVEEIKNGTAQ